MLGERLKLLREEHGLKQKDVAAFLDITPSAYGYYEQNKREPDLETLNSLAGYFHVSIDYLTGKSNNRDSSLKDIPEEIAAIFDYIREKSKDMTPDERKQLTKGIKAFIKAREEEK
jgi:transcriptional regulator with XRE-family HTH domain